MRYIHREYNKLANAHRPFRYNYVLANHPDPMKQIDPGTIDAVYTSEQSTPFAEADRESPSSKSSRLNSSIAPSTTYQKYHCHLTPAISG